MHTSDLTLVIPSYNRAHLIAETVQSALDQTVPFAEIIVVDDASSDDTLAVLQGFGAAITVIASGKAGVQGVRNKGVEAARSTYITLCDSDDLLDSRYVETMSKYLATHPQCDSVYTNFSTFGDVANIGDKFAQAPTGYYDGAIQKDGFLSNVPDLYIKSARFQPLFPTGLTMRKQVYQALGGFNPLFNGVGS
ncbi:MAG TPA: glycosyltransferase family 2 protein, partial [Burkholderiaceae bacterium]